LSEQADDVRQYGMSKEGLIARQFMLGVVQTAEGLPIYHEVFDGNQSEAATMLPTLKKVLGRFPHIKRLIVVADRGLLSIDIMEELSAIKLPSGQCLEFILAVPGRRYSEFADALQAFGAKAKLATDEIIEEVRWRDRRLVVAHHPHQAKEQTQLRNQRIAQLQVKAQAELMDGKLAQLRRIQRHRVSINAAKPIAGISVINDQQASVYASLKVKKPAQDNQTTLL
jgi:transposase